MKGALATEIHMKTADVEKHGKSSEERREEMRMRLLPPIGSKAAKSGISIEGHDLRADEERQ